MTEHIDHNLKILLASLAINSFKIVLNRELANQINEHLLQTLTNMLAMYYEGEKGLKAKYDDKTYAEICAKRLKIYLIDRDIPSYSFAEALTLFVIAITEENIYSEDINSKLGVINEKTEEYLIQLLPQNTPPAPSVSSKLNTPEELLERINSKLQAPSNIIDQNIEGANIDKNSNRLMGSSLAVGASIVGLSILGPAALVLALPLAYFGLTFGAKTIDVVEKLITSSPVKQTAIEEEITSRLYNLLKTNIEKTRSKAAEENKKPKPLDIHTLNQIKSEGIEQIIETLSNSKNTDPQPKLLIDKVAISRSKKERGL